MLSIHSGKNNLEETVPIPTNIAYLIDQQLAVTMRMFLRSAGEFGDRDKTRVFLVGGMVRDLLLGRPSRDPDLLVQGEQLTIEGGSNLARALARAWDGKVVTYPRFGTAKVAVNEFVADVSTARVETYRVPGALPDVAPATIEGDIGRRDFTINSLAVDLSPKGFGNLLDLYNGGEDLQTRTLRIIHERSFQDDPTRLLRAVRYAARLGLRMDPQTEIIARKSADYLKVVTGERIRNELERIFEEIEPEVAFNQAEEWHLFETLVPDMKWSPQLAETLAHIRIAEYEPSPLLPLALLVIRMGRDSVETFIERLNVPADWATVMRDTYRLGERLLSLSIPEHSRPSALCAKLSDLAPEAILGWSALAPEYHARELLINYYTKWRHVRPILTGDDLLALDVPQGPQIGELLRELVNARLDEVVLTREAEETFVRNRLISKK